MLAELGCQPISPRDAALRLGRRRAASIRESGEDPLPSMPYFYILLRAADGDVDFYDLAYFDDDCTFPEPPENTRKRAREAIEELLSPDLREQRMAARKAEWEHQAAEAKTEWPYVLNSPIGRELFKARYKEKVIELRPFILLFFAGWIIFGWTTGAWYISAKGYLIGLALLFLLPLWGEYRRMK